MTHDQAWAWLISNLGEQKALATVAVCEQYPDNLEAIVVVTYHASDPRRQQFRRAIRTLTQSEK